MTTKTFDVEIRPIDAIKPYEGNPRINDDAVDAVAASLREFLPPAMVPSRREALLTPRERVGCG